MGLPGKTFADLDPEINLDENALIAVQRNANHAVKRMALKKLVEILPNNVIKGDTGVRGSIIFKGEGPPDAEVGITGDYYIDAVAIQLLGPKTEQGWPESGISILGPPGILENNSGATITGSLSVTQMIDCKRLATEYVHSPYGHMSTVDNFETIGDTDHWKTFAEVRFKSGTFHLGTTGLITIELSIAGNGYGCTYKRVYSARPTSGGSAYTIELLDSQAVRSDGGEPEDLIRVVCLHQRLVRVQVKRPSTQAAFSDFVGRVTGVGVHTVTPGGHSSPVD